MFHGDLEEENEEEQGETSNQGHVKVSPYQLSVYRIRIILIPLMLLFTIIVKFTPSRFGLVYTW